MDEIDSGEGQEAPNKLGLMQRRRRNRKLSGPAAAALGELAFQMYRVCGTPVPSDAKWDMLKQLLLQWRSQFL